MVDTSARTRADLLWKFDCHLRAGGEPNIAEWLALWPNVAEHETFACELLQVAWELLGRDFGWLADEFGKPDLPLTRDSKIFVLRDTYLDFVETRTAVNWDEYAPFGFSADELDLRTDEERIRLGEAVGDRFHFVERLSAGGFSTVYRAVDQLTNEDLVAKAARSGEFTEEYQKRLLEEAKFLRRLKLPDIPQFIGLLEIRGGLVLLMEYVSGETLQQLYAEGRMARIDVLNLVAKVARVIDTMHEHGYIHGDIRPENVIVRPDGRVAVIDFGTWRRDVPTDAPPGVLGGTVSMMAPESLIVSSPSGTIAEDIYCLGAMLFLGLSGTLVRATHDRDSALRILRATSGRIDYPASITYDERRICDAALALDALDRFERAADFAEACELVADGRGDEAMTPRIRPELVGVRIGRCLGYLRAISGILQHTLEYRQTHVLESVLKGAAGVEYNLMCIQNLAPKLNCDIPDWPHTEEFVAHVSDALETGRVAAASLESLCDGLEWWARNAVSFLESDLVTGWVAHVLCYTLAVQMAAHCPEVGERWVEKPELGPLPPDIMRKMGHIYASTSDRALQAHMLRKIDRLMERFVLFECLLDENLHSLGAAADNGRPVASSISLNHS